MVFDCIYLFIVEDQLYEMHERCLWESNKYIVCLASIPEFFPLVLFLQSI